MKLWLDAGNTRLKWQLYQNNNCVSEGGRVHAGDLYSSMSLLVDDLQSLFSLDEINFVGLASVLNQQAFEQIASVCQSRFTCELQKAVVSRELKGVICAYQDVSKLGVDRWLAVVAAFNQSKKAVCVVSCGSALTIDMVDNAGNHLGGYILPGLTMSVRALTGQTHSVRFDEQNSVVTRALGRDTATAVLNGALVQAQASLKEVKRIFEEVCLNNQISDASYLFITGGDAKKVLESSDLDFVRQDDLVLQGLRLALDV